jgi:hypothetical protein
VRRTSVLTADIAARGPMPAVSERWPASRPAHVRNSGHLRVNMKTCQKRCQIRLSVMVHHLQPSGVCFRAGQVRSHCPYPYLLIYTCLIKNGSVCAVFVAKLGLRERASICTAPLHSLPAALDRELHSAMHRPRDVLAPDAQPVHSPLRLENIRICIATKTEQESV